MSHYRQLDYKISNHTAVRVSKKDVFMSVNNETSADKEITVNNKTLVMYINNLEDLLL